MIFGLYSTFHFLVCCTTDLEVEDTFNYYIFYHLYVTIISTLAWEQFWKKSCLSWPHFNTQQRSTYKNPLNSWLMTCVQNHFMLCLVLNFFLFLKKFEGNTVFEFRIYTYPKIWYQNLDIFKTLWCRNILAFFFFKIVILGCYLTCHFIIV